MFNASAKGSFLLTMPGATRSWLVASNFNSDVAAVSIITTPKMDAPERWERIANDLQGMMMVLYSVNPGKHDMGSAKNWEELTRHQFAAEAACRAEVDAAARFVVEHHSLPTDISATGRYFLGLRVGCAGDFLGMVFPPQATESPFGEIPEDWSDADILRWLLVDLWTRRFDTWIKLSAIAVMGPFAFYGLTDANPDIPA